MEQTRRSADDRAADYAAYVQDFIQNGYLGRGMAQGGEITMTDATEAIWGTSGRGNPNAVRLIEATADMGYLRIRAAGKRKRMVSRTSKPIKPEIYTYNGLTPPSKETHNAR